MSHTTEDLRTGYENTAEYLQRNSRRILAMRRHPADSGYEHQPMPFAPAPAEE